MSADWYSAVGEV